MQIDPLNTPGRLPSGADLATLQVGRRLRVEIISLESNQEGTISLDGKLIEAKIEAGFRAGDQFWATVKKVGNDGIVLSKADVPPQTDGLADARSRILINRGFPPDPVISRQLEKFISDNSSPVFSIINSKNPVVSKVLDLFFRITPKWEKLSGLNFQSLADYLCRLGLEYESNLVKSRRTMSNRRSPANFQETVFGDRTMLKMNLLQLAAGDSASLSPEDKAALTALLDDITGQQLWIQTGAEKNAYFLMHIPLQDNGMVYQAKIAVESRRHGNNIDLNHCRFALQVDTPNLGKVGADLTIYENRIHICLLHEDKNELEQIIPEYFDLTSRGFASIGYCLEQISVHNFEDYPGFDSFLTGKPRSGVDLTG